jgi:hypothetical protein
MAHPTKSQPSAEEPTKQQPPSSVQPVEPKEPAQAGAHRHAQHETLERSTREKQAQRHPAYVAAQHATGSFTNKDQKK